MNVLKDNKDLACFYTTKHSWRGKYKRVFSVGTHGITTYNPTTLEVTNQHILLLNLHLSNCSINPTSFPYLNRYNCYKHHWSDTRRTVGLEVTPGGIDQIDPHTNRVICSYDYRSVEGFAEVSDYQGGFCILYGGFSRLVSVSVWVFGHHCDRSRIFYVAINRKTDVIFVLLQVFALICDAENPQVFTIEFIRGQIRKYCSTERDSLMASLLDGVRASGNRDVCVKMAPTQRGQRWGLLSMPVDEEVESLHLRFLAAPPNGIFADAVFRFNANISYSGVLHAVTQDGLFSENKEKLINNAILALLSQDAELAGPNAELEAQFQAIRRLVASKAGFQAFTQLPKFREKLGVKTVKALKRNNNGVTHAAIDMLCALMCPMHDDYDLRQEQLNKASLLSSKKFLENLLEKFISNVEHGTGALVISALLDFLTFALCAPYSETTEGQQFDMLLEMVASNGRTLFKLFQHPSMAIVKGAGLVMKAIIEEGDKEIATKMQDLALSEGALPRHLHTSMFTVSADQRMLTNRQLSRHLVGLWIAENPVAMNLLKRILPTGLLAYLDSSDAVPEKDVDRMHIRDNLKIATDQFGRNKVPEWQRIAGKAAKEVEKFAKEKADLVLMHWRDKMGIAQKEVSFVWLWLLSFMQFPSGSANVCLSAVAWFLTRQNPNMVTNKRVSNSNYITQKTKSVNVCTHKNAKGQDIVQRSVLGPVLPEAMVCYLENYEAERFSEIFLGEFDTPEAIWSSEMRRMMIEKIAAHLADFTPRLQSNTRALYQYCPIPVVSFPQLDSELFCNIYYLRHLCDSNRFPNWPIRDPVKLLKDTLEAWKREVEKKPPSMSVDDAYEVLNLPIGQGQHEESKIRKAYFRLAQKYHPDKNPEGRDMFEKVNKAYEFLCTKSARIVDGPDPENIILILKTQSILFNRHRQELEPYKYAGYPMLIKTITMETGDEQLFSKTSPLLPAASELAFHTVNCSALNAEELRRESGIEVLLEALSRCVAVLTASSKPEDMAVQVCGHICKCYSVAAQFEECREKIIELPNIIRDVCHILYYGKVLPRLCSLSVQCVSSFAVDFFLQTHLYHAGVLWHLLVNLFNYDYTLEESGVQTSQETNQQEVANSLAKLSLVALGRLGGYRETVGPPPENPTVRKSLAAMLTPYVARKLGTSTPVLKLLNSNSENPYLIWNNGTRAELLEFLEAQQESNVKRGECDKSFGAEFVFSEHGKELIVGEIFVRVYNEQPAFPLEYPKAFAASLLDYVGSQAQYLHTLLAMTQTNKVESQQHAQRLRWAEMALEALRNVIKNNPGSETECINHFKLLFSLLRVHGAGKVQQLALEVHTHTHILREERHKTQCTPTTVFYTFRLCRLNSNSACEYIYAEHFKQQKDNPDVNWKMPEDFTVPYAAGQGELEVGGVFLRIFIAQPGWVLRKPREFLVSLLETLTELLEKNNPNGEALETVTTAAVCLFSTQTQLADQVPPLGHLPRILAALNHKNNAIPKSSIRLIHVLSDNELCVRSMAALETIGPLMTGMKVRADMAGLACEALNRMFQREQSDLVAQALRVELVPYLLKLLEGVGLETLDNPSATKAQIVKALKSMTRSLQYGEQVNEILSRSTVWSAFKDQKHDLFISESQTAGYLTGMKCFIYVWAISHVLPSPRHISEY
uniref:J domain-containing protein n=1 Tax=Astyanax mexicanus TaxID=7994 RepID=A0A8B9HJM2_ASTMX